MDKQQYSNRFDSKWQRGNTTKRRHEKKLLDAVDPRNKLEGGAGRGVTLDVRLGRTVDCVEHHKAVLRSSVLEETHKTQTYAQKHTYNQSP